jgi:hypothetical protein
MTIELALLAVLVAIAGGIIGWVLSHERRVSILETKAASQEKHLAVISGQLGQIVEAAHALEVQFVRRRSTDHD